MVGTGTPSTTTPDASPASGDRTGAGAGDFDTVTATVPRRHHEADNVFNLRDLGGYRTRAGATTRWGRIFRSDGLHRTTPAGAAVVAALGIRRVVDLRTDDEREGEGVFAHRPLDLAAGGAADGAAHVVDVVHLPILRQLWSLDELDRDDFDAPAFLFQGFCEMVGEHGERVAAVLQFVADHGEEPLVFHCTAGKDRTGVIAALLLALAGVDDDTIAEDFALSAPAAVRMAAWYRANPRRPSRPGARVVDPSRAMKLLSAEPETMHRFLGHLRAEHGSVEAYVRAVGLTDDQIESLVTHLVD